MIVRDRPLLCSIATANRSADWSASSRVSPTMGRPAAQGRGILFDGTSTDHFTKATMTPDGLLMQGCGRKPLFQDFNLHLEFLLPTCPPPKVRAGEQRSLSPKPVRGAGARLIRRGTGARRCGALYRFRKPDLNMCPPPLKCSRPDIIFTAPAGPLTAKIRNARHRLAQRREGPQQRGTC